MDLFTSVPNMTERNCIQCLFPYVTILLTKKKRISHIPYKILYLYVLLKLIDIYMHLLSNYTNLCKI